MAPTWATHSDLSSCNPLSAQKLFQAVEEARSLAHEGPGAGAGQQEAMQQQLIAYPPPVRDDFKKTSRQLLQWLKAAALDPLVRGAAACLSRDLTCVDTLPDSCS